MPLAIRDIGFGWLSMSRTTDETGEALPLAGLAPFQVYGSEYRLEGALALEIGGPGRFLVTTTAYPRIWMYDPSMRRNVSRPVACRPGGDWVCVETDHVISRGFQPRIELAPGYMLGYVPTVKAIPRTGAPPEVRYCGLVPASTAPTVVRWNQMLYYLREVPGETQKGLFGTLHGDGPSRSAPVGLTHFIPDLQQVPDAWLRPSGRSRARSRSLATIP